jgi:hypothetical protein
VTPESKITFSKLFGVREKPIRWTGPLAFLLAAWAGSVTVALVNLAMFDGPLPDLMGWLGLALSSFAKAIAALAAFKMCKGDLSAAVTAGVIYAVVWTIAFPLMHGMGPFFSLSALLPAFLNLACLLIGMALMLRIIVVTPLALLVGAALGAGLQLVLESLPVLESWFWRAGLSTGWIAITGNLAFAGVFFGGLQLFKRDEAGPAQPATLS